MATLALIGCSNTGVFVTVSAITIVAATPPSTGTLTTDANNIETWTPDTAAAGPQTLQLSAEISPANASTKTVTWSSSDSNAPQLISVDSSGLVTVAAGFTGNGGNYLITASATDYSGTKGTFEVSVAGN
jgi:hypothetical protein